MKHVTKLKIAGGLAIAFAVAIGWVFAHSAQPQPSKTGAPGENNCTQCHAGTVNSGSGSATLVLGANETTYTPGSDYVVTVNVTDGTKSRFGFQVTALQGGSGATVGTFSVIDATNTAIQTGTVSGSSRTYISHKSANATNSWSFKWTAPSTDVGMITFYLVGNATNSSNSTAGDNVYTRTFGFPSVSSLPPTSAFSASRTSVCQGGTVGFSSQSTNNPTNLQWSFPGGDPSASTAANPSIAYSTPGTYAVTLVATNANGSDTLVKPSFITVNALPQLTTSSTAVTCNGGNDGSIDLSVAGSTGNSFRWSNGSTVEDPSGLAPGTYTVTVTSGSGCISTASVTVSEPEAVAVQIGTTNSACDQSSGTATATPSGGTPGYSYAWSSGQTTATATGLAAGSYTVTVTDNQGCTSVGTAAVSNTGSPTGTVYYNNITCNGMQNGDAIIYDVTGGTPPYSYQWSNGGTTPDLYGLTAGTYTVTVSDGSNCQLVEAITITEPDSVTASASSTPQTSGNDGTATLTPSGGTGPYTYAWGNGQTTQTATNLSAGTYAVTITDANGCEFTASVTVNLSVGIHTQLTAEQFNVGPNPFGDRLVIRPNVEMEGRLMIHLVNIEGRIVHATTALAQPGVPIIVEPGSLADGVYLLMINTGDNKVLKKVYHHGN